MAAGFEFFTSADSGAPVLHGAAGRLIAVLDWALVGKGGWGKAFTGTNLAAYRSGTGNRFFLRVDDTQATYSRIRAHRNMTAISTGTNQFPTNTQAGNINTWGVRKSFESSTAADPQRYWGVRTNRYLVLIVESISAGQMPPLGLRYRNWMVFGDVPSLAEADAHNTIICAQPNIDNYYYDMIYNSMYRQALSPGYGYSTNSAGSAMSGTPNGAVASPLCGVHWPFGNDYGGDTIKAALALSDRMFFAPLIVGSTNSAIANNGAAPRARIPNAQALYGPCYDGNGSEGDPQLPATDLAPVTIGARQFLPIQRYGNGAGGYNTEALLLEMTDTDGAL